MATTAFIRIMDEGPITPPVHSFVRIMDEGPLVSLDANVTVTAILGPGTLSGQFEIEIPVNSVSGTGVITGISSIDNMAYVSRIQGSGEIQGQWYPGDPTAITASVITGTGSLLGSVSISGIEIEHITGIGIIKGRFRGTVSTSIPGYRVELRDGDGILRHILALKLQDLEWSSEPRAGGCKAASFTVLEPAVGLDEATLPEYDVQVKLDTGSGWITWWRGYLLNPRLTLDAGSSLYQMQLSALGWAHYLERLPIVGLGFKTEDGGVKFENLDAAAIARTLVDRANAAGAGLTYTQASVPDSGYLITSMQFNASTFSAISELAELAGESSWGVNRWKEFYFLPSITAPLTPPIRVHSFTRIMDEEPQASATVTTVNHTFFVGRDLEFAVHDYNHDGMINRIYLFGADERKWLIENIDDLSTDVSFTTDNAELGFGKATSNQKLVQNFTTALTSLSALDIKVGKTGFGSNLVADGDMELNDGSTPAHWTRIWNGTRLAKDATNPHGGTRSLRVSHDRSGKKRYGVYQDIVVTPGQALMISAFVKDPAVEDTVTIDILDGQTGARPATDADPVIIRLNNTTRTQTWYRLSGSFTPESALIGIRIWSRNHISDARQGPFYVDDVQVAVASDILLSIVERTSESPLVYNSDNPIASAVIPFDDIPNTPTVIRTYLTASPLSAAATYGIMLEIVGDLSDTAYFILAYDNAGTGLFSYNGVAFVTANGRAYHVTLLPTDQLVNGVRGETLYRPQLDNDDDAALYGKSFLAGRSSPVERGQIRLRPNANLLIEDTEPVELVRVAKGDIGRALDFTLRPERIQYSITERGLETSVELGEVLPRLAGAIKYMEYLLSLRE